MSSNEDVLNCRRHDKSRQFLYLDLQTSIAGRIVSLAIITWPLCLPHVNRIRLISIVTGAGALRTFKRIRRMRFYGGDLRGCAPARVQVLAVKRLLCIARMSDYL